MSEKRIRLECFNHSGVVPFNGFARSKSFNFDSYHHEFSLLIRFFNLLPTEHNLVQVKKNATPNSFQ